MRREFAMIANGFARKPAPRPPLRQRNRSLGAAPMALLLAVSFGACSSTGQTPAPLLSTAPNPASSSATAVTGSPRPTSPPSPSTSSSAKTIVEPTTAVEPALKTLWQRGGPAPSKPCSYSPSIDAKGRIWVAVCWDSKFWILSADGKFLEAWGTPGSAAGQFDFAFPASHDSIGGIAFAPDGTYYTFDAGNLRVQHFGMDRKLITSWGSFGTGEGQFAKPTSIAVDGKGRVYIADASRADVQIFEPDGTFVRTIGAGEIGDGGFAYIAVDSTGNVFASESHAIAKFGPDGGAMAVYDLAAIANDPAGMAVAASGSLFVAARGDSEAEATIELAPTGSILHIWPGTGESLAVDRSGKAAYVADVEWPFIRKYALPAP